MALRVLIVPDKFKGTLTAREAAGAIASGWRQAQPNDLLELLPMSDGGDGFGEVMGQLIGARQISCRSVDAAHRRHSTGWWWEPKTKIAILDTAAIIGLACCPAGDSIPSNWIRSVWAR
jgi:glycerate 2-kinase